MVKSNGLIIDADAHVLETEKTWDYLEPSEHKFRPTIVGSPNDPELEYWILNDKIRGFRFATLSEQQLATMSKKMGRKVDTPQSAREMDDVSLRLDHMNKLGIDIQVLHNTMWIQEVADMEDAEIALCMSWNRWMADLWKQSNNRLRWACVMPAMNIKESLQQMKFARENKDKKNIIK